MSACGHILANLEDHLEADRRRGGEAEHAEVPDEPRGNRVAPTTRRSTCSTDGHILVCVVCAYGGKKSTQK